MSKKKKKRVLISGSYFPSTVATLRDLHCHLPGTRCPELLPLQIVSIIQWRCRRCPIVFLQDRGVWDRRSCFRGFHHQHLLSWHRCASVTPEHFAPVSPRVSSTREVAWLSQHGRVSTPTSVGCDPRCGAGTSCLSAASSLYCLLSALGQFSLQFNVLPGQTVHGRRKMLLHRSDGFLRHRRPEESGTIH